MLTEEAIEIDHLTEYASKLLGHLILVNLVLFEIVEVVRPRAVDVCAARLALPPSISQ